MREKTVIDAVQPFDFDLTAKVFSDEVGLCMRDEHICKYSDGKFWRVLRVNSKLILTIVRSIGSVDEPRLEVELISNKEISEKDKAITKEKISFIFDTNFDLKPFYEDVKQDKIMSRLINKLYGLKIARCPTVFEALVYVILEQQISLRAAYNIERRFVKSFGDKLKVYDKVYYAFPSPEKIAPLEVEELRSCGMSRRKGEYIHGISKLIVRGVLDLEALKREKNEEYILKELCRIRGVGPWTAKLVMIRGMGKLSVIPAEDLGLKQHIAYYYFGFKRGRVPSEKVHKISQRWGKWIGIAGFYPVMAWRLGIRI